MKNYAHHIRKTLNMLIHELAEHIEEFCYDSERNFTRKRNLPPETLLSILIGIGCDPLRNELLKYWNYTLEPPTAPAFVQQRRKLKPLALETLSRHFVNKTVTPKLYCGYRLLAADGSDLQFSTNPKNPGSYVPASEKKPHFSLMHLNAPFDLSTGLYLVAVAQKTRLSNENAASVEMVDCSDITESVIVIADRN